MEIGQNVTFVDETGVERQALVTAVHGADGDCVNLVYVNPDTNQRDDYGRKLVRASSVVHQKRQPAQGNYFFK